MGYSTETESLLGPINVGLEGGKTHGTGFGKTLFNVMCTMAGAGGLNRWFILVTWTK